jgi:hypothetical protein
MANYNAIRYNHDFLGQGGSLVLLSTFTSDGSDANATFNSSIITDAFDEYLIIFNNIHPESTNTSLNFNGSIDNGSNYNVAKTTTNFQTYNDEEDEASTLNYSNTADLAEGTGFQILGYGVGTDNHESCSGIMKLYNPSSTTFVKHFVCQLHLAEHDNFSIDYFTGGYFNTTSAINNIQFKMSSGEIQDGTISVFGVS